MPELPEVETTRLGLESHMRGATISHIEVIRRDLRQPIPADFETLFTGKRITRLRRRAKYILIDCDAAPSMLVHLGMSGTLTVSEKKRYVPRKHDHCILTLSNGWCVIFHDPRRFGLMLPINPSKELEHPLLAHLGPEPLSNHFSAPYLMEMLVKRTSAVKLAIMDQTLVVGVGNIYASESLFLAGIDPRMSACKASKHAAKLAPAIQQVLRAALASGGSTLRDYVRSSGDSGYFQHQFKVYDRAGKPCESCSQPIQHLVQAGRSTYFCKHCQTRR